MEFREDEAEVLSSLEERVLRAVEVVTALRKENASLNDQLKTAVAERQQVEASLTAAQHEMSQLNKELENLRGERKQVRSRIEKLLGQMDLLSAG